MAFKQIVSSTKTDRVEPYVSILATGVVFNPAAIDEIGKENERTIVFYDKETNRLAFVFMRATMAGSYSFSSIAKSRSRRIGIGKFLKMNKILEKANGNEFPLQTLKETVEDFEGSTVFFVDLSGKKSLTEIRSEAAKKKWDDPVWAERQRKLIKAGKAKQKKRS